MADCTNITSRRGVLTGALAASALISATAAPAIGPTATEWSALAGLPKLLATRTSSDRWNALMLSVVEARREVERLELRLSHMQDGTTRRLVREAHGLLAEAAFALLEEPAPSPAALLDKVAVALFADMAEDGAVLIAADLAGHGVQ